jgi:hypothetical protein
MRVQQAVIKLGRLFGGAPTVGFIKRQNVFNADTFLSEIVIFGVNT